MGAYRVAQICLNGHTITASSDTYPQFKEAYCSKCGKPTITTCPNCNTSIRGYYEDEDGFGFGSDYSPPSFCYNCGKPFPWTEEKLASAIALLELSKKFSEDELQTVRSDLIELATDSPRTQVAAIRFKEVLGRVGASVGEGLRSILVDIASETAKKTIWG